MSLQAIFFAVLNAMPFVVALLLGVALPALGVLSYSRFGAGLGVIAFMYAVEAVAMEVGGFQLGLTIYYTDLVLVFIGVITLLRFMNASDTPRWHWAWGLYVLAFVVSLVTGFIAIGASAGVGARLYFYSIAAGSYAMSFPINAARVRLMLNTCLWLTFLFMACCIYRWIVYYTPINDLLPRGGVWNEDGAIRVIRSYETVVMAQVFVVGLFFAVLGRGAMVARFVAPVTLGFVIALQHRSVWLSLMVGVMTALFVARSRTGSKAGQIVMLAAIVGLTSLPLVFSSALSGVTDQVASSADRAVDGDGTVGERFDNWQGMIQLWAAGGPRALVFGQGFGADATRYVHDNVHGGEHKINYYAHNHYVQTLFSLGLLGVFAFVAVSWYAARGLYRRCASEEGDPTAEALLTLLLMQLAYYVPYGTDYWQSVILGVCIAYVAGHERVARLAVVQTRRLPRHGLRWMRP